MIIIILLLINIPYSQKINIGAWELSLAVGSKIAIATVFILADINLVVRHRIATITNYFVYMYLVSVRGGKVGGVSSSPLGGLQVSMKPDSNRILQRTA